MPPDSASCGHAVTFSGRQAASAVADRRVDRPGAAGAHDAPRRIPPGFSHSPREGARRMMASRRGPACRASPKETPMTDMSTHPTQLAGAWLADFSSALERGDVDAAVALFEPECYWRDLVAFTWN